MPDYIIVWGARLSNGLSDWDGEGSILQINENAKTDVWTYNIKGKRIPAIKVRPFLGGSVGEVSGQGGLE